MSYYSRYVPLYSFARGDLYGGLSRSTPIPMLKDFFGYTQYENTQNSLSAQMDYEQYLKAGNERALRDWHKNLPGREIKYPEFSYAGQIYRSNTSIARAGFDYDTASANYYGNLPYRSAGLYGIVGKLSRSL